jgi:phospholipid/cholesterol/gamma-HCH transport system substrate-binding protein
MNSKVTYILVGIFVLVFATALIGGVLWLGSGNAGKHYTDYVVYMTESVSGLSKDSAVKYRGVVIGRVRDIRLDPKNPQRVRLGLEIERGTPVKTDTVATLETQGLTGLAAVNLTGGSPGAPMLEAKAGQRYPVIPSKPSPWGSLPETVPALVNKLSKASDAFSELLNSDNRRTVGEILLDLRTTSRTLAAHSKSMARALDDFSATLRNTRDASRRLPALLAQLHRSATALDRMAQSLARAGNRVSRTVAGSGKDLRRFGNQLLPQTQELMSELQRAAANLRQLSDELKRDPSILLYGSPQPAPGPGE